MMPAKVFHMVLKILLYHHHHHRRRRHRRHHHRRRRHRRRCAIFVVVIVVIVAQGEEGFLAVVRRDGFCWGDSSSLMSALVGLRQDTLGIVRLCARPCVFRRELRPPPQIEE